MSNQLRLDVAQLTDVGRKRPHNEDHMAHVIPKDPQTLAKKGALFVVADGMGGHAAGEIASEIAVETVSLVYYQDDSEDVSTSLVHAIKRANTLINQRAAENMLRSGMGTTCIAAVLRGSTAYIANVGDSRLYLVRENHVRQISQDHSWVAEQVRAKLLTEEQARSHAQRNVITRCLGTQAEVEVDLFIEPLEVGDALVLCSDGLSGLIEEDELCRIVNQYVPQESVYHLIERANEHGGPDNITAIVVRVQEVGWEPVPVARNGSNGHAERTADAIAEMPTLGLPTQTERGWPNAPQHFSSGPLTNDDSVQLTSQPSRKGRRLLYPSLIVALLLLVALVGSGIFYLFRLGPMNVDKTLNNAQTLIQRANSVTSSNPTQALQYLSTAQRDLQSLPGTSSLTDTQSSRLSTLKNDLVSSVRQAVTNYNQRAFIIPMSCLGGTLSTISTGSTGTQAASMVTVADTKTSATLSYVLGEDNILYQLSAGKSLVNPLKWSPTSTQVVAVANNGLRLLALTKVPAQANASPVYSLNILTPASNGELHISNSQKIQPTPSNTPTQTPTLLTAWGDDVYVVLTSTTSQTITIAHYTVNNNKLNTNPDSATVSTSSPLVSIAAFPNKELFFLLKVGIVQSMQFASGSQTPTSVVVPSQLPILQPLEMEVGSFTVATPVPTPMTQPETFLTVPNATLLVAGSVNGVSHLYIADSGGHRVLSLKSSPVTSTLPTSSGTSPTQPTILELDAQFIDTNLAPSTSIISVVTDPNPKVSQVYVLMNDTNKMTTLFSFNPTSNATCPAKQ